MTKSLLKTVALLAALSMAGCTMKSQEAPPLSGPSEYGKSISIAINPDVLTQDGASQSRVTITAFNSEGKAERNVSLRAEIRVQGIPVDFGSLSARNLVTDNTGAATLVYTAPFAGPGPSVDQGIVVDIVITPVGNDFNNSSARTAAIRLVPSGSVVPPDGLRPAFTFTPTTPTDNQTVLFDASTSTSGSGNPIARYAWNFGDGGSATGVTASHAYATAGSYVVTLTISDAVGRSAQKTSNILVGAGLDPTASFTASPDEPLVGERVNFNASASRPAPGFTIVSYEWDFGDGTTGDGSTAAHSYSAAGTYTVTLNVTDSAGHDGTSTQTVTVGGGASPAAAFTFSPASPTVNQTVNFNASESSSGSTIQSYVWNFGDGTTGQGQVTTHSYGAIGVYAVTLTITDSSGRTTTARRDVTVGVGAEASASFTYAPLAPGVFQPVIVNASASRPSPGATITSYAWTFGEGTAEQGQSTTHIYAEAGTYIITLTVRDSAGFAATTSQAVTVRSLDIAADFTFSPLDPTAGSSVNFNASSSRPAPFQTITNYEWSFGDGTTATGVVPTPHAYTLPGTYLVVLTVIDSAGNRGTTTKSVTVKP